MKLCIFAVDARITTLIEKQEKLGTLQSAAGVLVNMVQIGSGAQSFYS